MEFILKPGQLTFNDIKLLLNEKTQIVLDKRCLKAIKASEQVVKNTIAAKKIVYGINTGFGKLANTQIKTADLETLQRKIVLSHAAGTGKLFSDDIVRLMLALKINSLARGYSGVRLQTIEALIKLYNANIYPCIPSQGSVGASGDLAPLAHMSAILLGVGEASYKGKKISAQTALAKIGMKALVLGPKEGLALLNGTQASTALALAALVAAEKIFNASLLAGALSVDAARGSIVPFDERIQKVRGHVSQIAVAKVLRNLLSGSKILASHKKDCEKIQDPYSLRCQPQVMGACLTQLLHSKDILIIEANAVSDNPLVFAEDNTIISGGNFHAEPVAIAADGMAVALSEIGAISERRIALLVDPHFSGLPAFLVKNPGINSGFMLAQVTAAALASENKTLAHPASVDNIPTSANQEDHVSMATFGARRLSDVAENVTGIIGIELLASCQGIDFLRPLKTTAILEQVHKQVRSVVKHYSEDRFFAPDIENIKNLITQGTLSKQFAF